VDERIANVEQAEYWNTAASVHWIEYQDRHDAVVAPLDSHLFAAADIAAGDRVLDVGCGCGATTRAAARSAAAGDATGIDLSAAMLDRARAVAGEEGLANVRFVQGDAQVHPFDEGRIDVAISRLGVMFFADPAAAFANLARATQVHGRLAFCCWQELPRNDWIMVPATAALSHVPPPDFRSPGEPGPFSLADPDGVRRILSAAGWRDVDLQAVEEQLPIGDDADEAFTFIRGIRSFRRMLEGADESTAARALDAVRDALAERETSDGVGLGSAAWVVTARR
jgi:SAM-dependent methyltransferase